MLYAANYFKGVIRISRPLKTRWGCFLVPFMDVYGQVFEAKSMKKQRVSC
jgi:hypothetical protein